MKNDNIYYINIKPYIYDIPFETMIERLQNSKIISFENENIMKAHILNFMKNFNHIFIKKTKESHNIDIILSKKILQHLHIFFNKKSSTRKRHIVKNKNTKNTKKITIKKNKVS